MAEEKKIVKYRFVGPGQGVTGLPHEVTAEQAQDWEAAYQFFKKTASAGDLATMPWGILQGAIERGIYEEVKPKKVEGGKTL